MTRQRALALAISALVVLSSCHSIDEDGFAHGPVPQDVLPLSEPISYTVGPNATQVVPEQHGLLGSYFNGAQYVNAPKNESLVFQRIDPNIEFEWDASDTNPVIPADQGGIDHSDGDPRLPDHWPIWSIVWEGYLGVGLDATYTLRLHVNNGGWLQMKDSSGALVTVISCPGGASFEGNCDSAPLHLSPGRQYIRISYYNNAPPSATAKFLWTGPDGADFSIVSTQALYTQLEPITTNTTPVVTTFLAETLKQGGILGRDGAFTDPDVGDSWVASVDYGDGAGAQDLQLIGQRFGLTHHYIKLGTFTVTVVVTDSTGLQGRSQFVVTIEKPKMPPTTATYYVYSADENLLYTAGCDEGKRATDNKLKDGLVILDFGKATKLRDGTYGAILWWDGTTSTADIATATETYIKGLFNCSPEDAYFEVAIGTNNCTFDPACVQSETNFAHGKAWAEMVRDVNVWMTEDCNTTREHCFRNKISAAGANDLELAWETPANSAAWADGFASVTTGGPGYYNFGAADACPSLGIQGAGDRLCVPANVRCTFVGTTLRCVDSSVTWKQSEVAYISWGNLAAWPAPEIYLTNGTHAKQWQKISLQYALTHESRPIEFPVPLSQRGACEENGTPDAFTCGTPQQAWDFMVSELFGDERTATFGDLSFRWSTDIRKLIPSR